MKFFICFIFITKLSFSYINIYPSSFYKNLNNKDITQTFILTNNKKEQVRYRVYLEKNSEKDMTDWIEIYPKSLILNFQEIKELKLKIEVPQNQHSGEYSTKLILKEISPPKLLLKEKKQMRVMTILRIELKGYLGDLKTNINGNLKDIDGYIQGDLNNSGERGGLFNIYTYSNNKKEFFDSLFISSKKNIKYKKKIKKVKKIEKIEIVEEIIKN